jgi:serine palmitoyltransferase
MSQYMIPETETSSHSSIESEASDDSSKISTIFKESDELQTLENDPYADVRDKLEARSLASRNKYALHITTDDDDDGDRDHDHPHNGPSIPFFVAMTTYLGYAILIFVGHIRDLCAKIFRKGRYLSSNRRATNAQSDNFQLYAPLLQSWENFYTKRLYHRIQDCFNRPVASNPGATIQMLERISSDGNKTLHVMGTLENIDNDSEREVYLKGKHFNTVSGGRVTRKVLNLGSYNYLGFADDWDVTCKDGVLSSLEVLPVNIGSCRMEYGSTKLHKEAEMLISEFLGKEDAMILNMGFNTNATTIPALTGRGDLIISDDLNHTSIVNGARASGAAIRLFPHNDAKTLDYILREAIVCGQPRTRRPWKKIMVIVEGIYSMEGEYCDLRSIVKVCKKYGAYIFLDEAHSIGAMGSTGRGCCEYTGVDTQDIDIMMGTFTKSFGAMGGYVAGSKDVIDALRYHCAASSYHNAMSPIVCQQIITSLKVR